MQCQSKSQHITFVDIDKLILKFIFQGKSPKIAYSVLRRIKITDST